MVGNVRKGHPSTPGDALSASSSSKRPKTTNTPRRSVGDMFDEALPPLLPPVTSSGVATLELPRTPLATNDTNIPQSVSAARANSNSRNSIANSDESLTVSTGPVDTTVINMVVADDFFPEVKFVARDDDLAWDDDKASFCQFFIDSCKVPAEIDLKEWWKLARTAIMHAMSQTRNDRNTAVKNAFLGKSNN